MAKQFSPLVLILGQDSLRADRALEDVLRAREIDPSEVVRIWGDESSFAEVFAAASSRSLFSDRTVVLVRRAEKLRGGGKEEPGEDADDGRDSEASEPTSPEPVRPKPASNDKGRKSGAKGAGPASDLPDLDPRSTLVLVVRKADRRFGMWKKISKVAEMIDADYLKGRSLNMAAAAEASALGLRVSDEVLQDIIEHSGPALGRIASELEKVFLYQHATGRGTEDTLAVTSAPPLYRLSDAFMLKNKRECLSLLDEALRQGEAGLRVLATLHFTIRKLAMFRALRRAGSSSAEAGAQAGILPFKVAETDRAYRAWSEPDLGRALAVFAEADRRLKLSAPVGPLLTHSLVVATRGGRA